MLIVICLCVVLRSTNCQTHRPNNFYRGYPEVQQNPSVGKPYGTDNVKNHGGSSYYPLLDVSDNDNKKWQTLESSVHHHGDGSNAAPAAPGLTDITAVTVKSGSPVVVSGGSLVIRPSAGGFVVDGGGGIGMLGEPEAAGIQLKQPLSVGPYDLASDEVLHYGSSPLQHHQQFGYPFFHVSGLLQRLLFGKAIFGPSPLDGYSPLCSRLTAVSRFLLNRVFEPLFATGFFMAASYLFRTSVLPRIAHYIHVYTMLKDHVDDGRFVNGRQISGYLDILTAAVNDAVNDDRPCLRRIACEAGLQVARSPVARSVRSMVKTIMSEHEFMHIFKESLTGSVFDCSQYMCKNYGGRSLLIHSTGLDHSNLTFIFQVLNSHP
ncbi:uncharacterized protein LOC113555640 [Rhopalosiphum maidis]|uniref:uncharacterized protein LOC113555640 n=1 Tax=Rhopalosiphum maidis TaxID=43146 RepID=UPI000EFEBA10|nr:uncharacterized protein LOC113555640 [Rhopalosiphum maidis]